MIEGPKALDFFFRGIWVALPNGMKTKTHSKSKVVDFGVKSLVICLTVISALSPAEAGWLDRVLGRRTVTVETAAQALARGAHGDLISFQRNATRITDYLMSVKRPATNREHNMLVITGQPGAGKTSSVLSYFKEIQRLSPTHPLYNHEIQHVKVSDLVDTIFRKDAPPTERDMVRFERAVYSLVSQARSNPNITLFVSDFHKLTSLPAGFADNNRMDDFVKRIVGSFMTLRNERGLIIELPSDFLRQGSTLYPEANRLFGWPLRREEGVFDPSNPHYRLSVLEISDLSIQETRRVLLSIRKGFELRKGAEISESAIDKAIEITQKVRDNNVSFLAQTLRHLEQGADLLVNGLDHFRKLQEELSLKIEDLQLRLSEINQPQVINGEFKTRRTQQIMAELNPLLDSQRELIEKLPAVQQHIETLANQRIALVRNLEQIKKLEDELRVLQQTSNQTVLASKSSEIDRLKVDNAEIRSIAEITERALDDLGSSVRLGVNGDVVTAAYARTSGQTVDAVQKLLAGKLSDYFSPDLLNKLKANIVGQNDIIDRFWISLRSALSGNRVDVMKPLYKGLFLGPPGTGKTEIAKQIAKDMYLKLSSLGHRIKGNIDDPSSWGTFAEFNAAEFLKKEDASKFIGAGPGYVGYGELPRHLKVLEEAQGRPVVFLIDEVEKAAPEFTELLLKWMNGEPLVSGDGKVFPSHNIIFVVTSNAITERGQLQTRAQIAQHLYTGAWIDRAERADKQNPFVQAFLSRMTGIEIFNPFTVETLMHTTSIFQATHLRRLLPQKIFYRIEERLRRTLAEISLGPTNGARVLQTNFDDLIGGSIEAGVETGLIRVNEGRSYVVRIEPVQPGKEYLRFVQNGDQNYGIYITERSEVGSNAN